MLPDSSNTAEGAGVEAIIDRCGENLKTLGLFFFLLLWSQTMNSAEAEASFQLRSAPNSFIFDYI